MDQPMRCPGCGRELKTTGWDFGVCGCAESRAHDQASPYSPPLSVEAVREREREGVRKRMEMGAAEGRSEAASNGADMATPRQILGQRLRAQTAKPKPAAKPRAHTPAPPPVSEISDTPAEAAEDLTPLQLIDAALEAFLSGRVSDETLAIVQRQEIVNMPDVGATQTEWAVIRLAAIEQGLWLGELGQRWPLLLGRRHVTEWLRDPRMAKLCGLERSLSARYADRMIGNAIDQLATWGALKRLPESEKVACGGRKMWAYQLGVRADRPTEPARLDAHEPDDQFRDFEFVAGAEFAAVDGDAITVRDMAFRGGRGIHE